VLGDVGIELVGEPLREVGRVGIGRHELAAYPSALRPPPSQGRPEHPVFPSVPGRRLRHLRASVGGGCPTLAEWTRR
jgi:hypothetical protein